MQCCVCGWEAKWKQRYERDNGFGICPACAKEESQKLTAEEMRSNYGVENVNYFLQKKKAGTQ